MEEKEKVEIKETTVLEKFEGEPVPENLIEKVFIEDGTIVKHEYYENGDLVSTQEVN